jgi:hypothetical protein
MFYGPDDKTATKVAVGIILGEKQKAASLRRWTSERDVREDPRIAEEIRSFIVESRVRTVGMTGKINGCPHGKGRTMRVRSVLNAPSGRAATVGPHRPNSFARSLGALGGAELRYGARLAFDA